MGVVVVVLLVEPVADTAGGQPEAEPMERRAVRGFAVECQRVEAYLGWRPIRLGSGRQCAQNHFGSPAYSRLARDGVDATGVAGHECRPVFRIGDALQGFVDQPVQRPVATVGHQVGDPWAKLRHHLAEALLRGGFVHLAPLADNATQFGGPLGRSTIPACVRIDDDA